MTTEPSESDAFIRSIGEAIMKHPNGPQAGLDSLHEYASAGFRRDQSEREALARIIDPHGVMLATVRLARADAILAAGWRRAALPHLGITELLLTAAACVEHKAGMAATPDGLARRLREMAERMTHDA